MTEDDSTLPQVADVVAVERRRKKNEHDVNQFTFGQHDTCYHIASGDFGPSVVNRRRDTTFRARRRNFFCAS
jgi:hypothetical protein